MRPDLGFCTRRQLLGMAGAAVLALRGPSSIAAAQLRDELTVRPGARPTPIRGSDGRTYLAYELHLTSHRGDFLLERVRVLDGRDTLLAYGPDDLDSRIMRPELPRSARYGRLVRQNTTAVLSVWLALRDGINAPRSLGHELHSAAATGFVRAANLTIEREEPLVLGPPLRQGLWLAHNGPGDHRAAHWGSMLVRGSRIVVPQRYAIDFLGLDERGRGIRGALKDSVNTDWVGFGADVIAVADGVVREIRDGVSDNPPLFEPPPPTGLTLAAVGGNYVVLEVGRNRFVHFVHLQQGSVAVRVGQRLSRGQLLGRVGNSGNTNGAHLHFNVVDRLRLEEAEGLPYVLEGVVTHGRATADAAFGDTPTSPGPAQDVQTALPLNGALVAFANGSQRSA